MDGLLAAARHLRSHGNGPDHFTALTPSPAPDAPHAFAEELATYLSLLGAEFRQGKELPDFRAGGVADVRPRVA